MSHDQITKALINEVARARRRFPSNKYLLHAFAEEAGEVTKAFMDMKQKSGTKEEITQELIQAMAMAYRLLQEGDADFE